MEGEKELCRMRIKILQETKEDLVNKINPLLSEKTMGLYDELGTAFNNAIDEEAKFLS